MRRKSFSFLPAQLLSLALITTGCASFPVSSVINALPINASEEAFVDDTADDELTELVTTMRQDLTTHRMRERERIAVLKPAAAAIPKSTYGYVNVSPAAAPSIDAFATRNGFSSSLPSLLLPVVGIETTRLRDNWGVSRDGGRRRHRGIDIFAPRGRELVAVADGYISFIGDQGKGGHVVWLRTPSGYSFYYAHLEKWAPGIYEGMQVRAGDLLGYVGTTGNAKGSSPHLHFSVHDPNDEAVNPYPLLKFSQFVSSAVPTHLAGFSRGTD